MNDKLTKNERRQQARENARLAQEAEKKREKRNRLMLQGGIVLVVLAVIGIVALVLTQTMKPAGPGPVNMVSGGVTFTTDLEVVETPALGEGEERVSRDIDFDALPVDVAIYVDYSCPGCGTFEQTYGEMLERYTGNGDINLTVYPVNFLDANSGTKYSTRAANLVSCVVEQQPEFAFALHNELLSANVQPGQNQPNWHTDEQLIEIAETVGVDPNTELKQCMKDQRFAGFISGNWKAASETGLLGLADGAVLYANPSTGELQNPDGPQRLVSTPTVIINGQQWNSATDGDLETYILKLIAENGGADEAAESAEDEAATE
ncbi:MAG: thioredoxin domain-containing protein [Microbacteriaceae bacterium]|nr:thioredoxin domain-containing protein [Microbacteriaceae bacterium]